MKKLFSFSLTLLAALLPVTVIRAENAIETESVECSKAALFAEASADPAPRQYAPDRTVQALHLALDVTPDFEHRSVSASATVKFRPLAKPTQEVDFDAIGLDISAVESSVKLRAYQVTDDKIIVTFAEPIPAGNEVSVTFKYSAQPDRGLYFRTPEMGYKAGDTHLFSQGESIEARHWYPCLDSPNQRLTSEITCRVPEGMTVVSNGRLVSDTVDAKSGLRVVHWSQDKPHANYLVSLVAGYFAKIEDSDHGVPLAFFTPPSEKNEALSSFRDTKDMVNFFEHEIGVDYPWAKYYQVCVNDFVAGGMENTSATTLTDRTLFRPETENIRNSEGLIAHELAHQWFGDFVTCKDWSHIWLNEGFATYYETLYNEHKNGRDSALYELYSRARMITEMTNDYEPIVRRNFRDPEEMFGYLVYPKAGWVLHMLRAQLGKELYRACIRTYLQRHQLGNVTTEDLRSVIEELSGRSYDRFFDQWLYHGHFPEIEASYSWDEANRMAKLSIRQVQEVNAKVLLFQFPLTVRFSGKTSVSQKVIQVTKAQEDFYFPLDAAPTQVRLDPDYTLLAKIKFALPAPMLEAQLSDKQDMIGRLLAIEQYATKHDQGTISKLQKVLNDDAFYGVRLEAAKALRSIHSAEALDSLLASQQQKDARVRREVLSDINGFYDDKAYAAARDALRTEKNPEIISVALRGMAGYTQPGVLEQLDSYLGKHSYRNELADASIAALRLQDDPASVSPMMKALTEQAGAFTSRGFGQGLDALAYLDRNEENKAAVRTFLVAHVNDKRKVVQLADIRALGVLGDPAAIAVLDKFASASKESAERKAAERSLEQLRAGRKPVDDFKNLRQEVEQLEKSNRELHKQLDDLDKKVSATAGTTPGASDKGSAKPRSANPRLVSPKS